MYLAIRNRGNWNRNFLEYIGYSKKTPANDTIGRFGTGAKFASVAALRLGLQVFIASSDHLGRYVLRFEKERVDLGDGEMADGLKLHYWLKDDDGNVTESIVRRKIVIDAFRDWTEPIGSDDSRVFRIVREFISNAHDEDRQFLMREVDKPSFVAEGETWVFIRKSDEVRQIIERPERYFKFLAERSHPLRKVTVPGIGSAYDKSDPSATRIFVRGVLVSCNDHYWERSCLDYSLDRNDLVSEDRTVKNAAELKKEVGRLLAGLSTPDLVKGILNEMLGGRAELEKSALGYVRDISEPARSVWISALREIYDNNKLCTPSGSRITDQDAAQIMGYTVVHTPFGLGKFYEEVLGLPNAKKIVPSKPKYAILRFVDLDEGSRKRFMTAFRLFAKYYPDRLRWPIVVAKVNDAGRTSGLAGVDDSVFMEVWILTLTNNELRSVSDILSALIHESRHCETRAYDYDRTFVGRAEQEILRLIYLSEGMTHDPEGKILVPLGDPDKVRPKIIDPFVVDLGDGESIEIKVEIEPDDGPDDEDKNE